MIQLSSKRMTHHSVMTSSLRIKNFVIFSDIDFSSKTDIFRDVIALIINQCEHWRPNGSSGEYSVRQPRSASKRSALVNTNT